MVEFVKFIWQLPQIIIAFIYYFYLKHRDELLVLYTYKKVMVFIKRHPTGSVTLGDCIFLSPKATDTTIRHEYGHTRQSLILGPLYLIIIGLPSIIWAACHKTIAPDRNYYDFYTEHWANKLGGA